MTTTPDRRPGPLEEDEEIRLIANSTEPTQAGALNFNGEKFQLRDVLGTFDPRSSGGGITEEQHQGLKTLVHWVDENSFDEVTRTASRVTNITVWDSSSKIRKIREEQITRVGGKVSQIVSIQYDAVGNLKETQTEVISRTAGKVSSIIRTRVP
jgi:hypothetical protein